MAKLQLIYFEGDTYIQKTDGLWENISSRVKTKKDEEYYIKGLIRKELRTTNQSAINSEYHELKMDTIFDNNKDIKTVDRNKIYFKNGYFDLIANSFVKQSHPPFTPFQIPFDYKELSDIESTIPKDKKELADTFFKKFSGEDIETETLLKEIIGSSMSPQNDSIMPILYSSHSTSGKGTFLEIIGNITGKMREIKGDKWWGENESFSLSSIRNQLVGFIDEVPNALPKASTEKIKSNADSKDYLEIERKGIDQERIINSLTFIATTNNKVEFYNIDDALKSRVIWIECKMNQFTKTNEFNLSEIDKLKNDKDIIEYIISMSMEKYREVKGRAGKRNEKFTLTSGHHSFWNSISALNKGMEIMEHDQTLVDLWTAKVDFIANGDLKIAFDRYKDANKEEKILMKGFKMELINYINSNKLGTAELGKSTDGKHRGIVIEWKNEDPMEELVSTPWGDQMKRSEWEKYMEIQEKMAMAMEKEAQSHGNN